MQIRGHEQACQIFAGRSLRQGRSQVGDRRLGPTCGFEMARQCSCEVGPPACDLLASLFDQLTCGSVSAGDLVVEVRESNEELAASGSLEQSPKLIGERNVDQAVPPVNAD